MASDAVTLTIPGQDSAERAVRLSSPDKAVWPAGEASAAITKRDDRQLTLDTIVDQMESEYGVNVDEEMARLMELQNAYAANARVVSVVKELLDALLAAT